MTRARVIAEFIVFHAAMAVMMAVFSALELAR